MKLADRVARLEAHRSASPADDLFAFDLLDRLTDDELAELGGLFRSHGAEYLAGMPADAQARALALLARAKVRLVQSSNQASARPGETRD